MAKVKPYGVRALELELGIEIPLSSLEDYKGPRIVLTCSGDHAVGAAPHHPTQCAGSRMIVDELGADAAAVVLSRVWAWFAAEKKCRRYVLEGDVRSTLDGGQSPVGKRLVLKAPKPSLHLGERKLSSRSTARVVSFVAKDKGNGAKPNGQRELPLGGPALGPRKCPQRGNRGYNGRIATVRALERLARKKKRKHENNRPSANAAKRQSHLAV